MSTFVRRWTWTKPTSRKQRNNARPRLQALEHRLTPAVAAWVAQGPGPTINAQVTVNPDDNINGAIQAIAPQPGNADVLYAGTVNGGVWKTSNATAVSPTWTPLTDSLQSLSIGDIQFDLSDATSKTLIVGTGRLSNFAQRGDDEIGLYYTTNGGTSFSVFSDPLLLNEKFIGVAARGSTLLAASTGTGLYRSTNTGSTWANVSGINGLSAGGIVDLVDDPTDLNRFYVAVHQVGVFRTTDAGANWTNVTAGLSGVAGSPIIRLAVNASAGVLYAAVPASGAGASVQVFRSANQGGTWTALDTVVVHPGGQQFPNTGLAAHPTNVNLAFLSGDRISGSPFTGNAARVDASKAGGSQWTTIVDGNASNTSPHADSRNMAFMADGTLLECSDGGVYGLSNPHTTGGSWRSVGGDIQAMEAHDVAWNAISNTIVIGTQDNGTHQQPTTGSLSWNWFNGGDGGDVAIDSVSLAGSNQAIRYYSSQNLGGFRRQVVDINNNPVGGSVGLAGITGAQFVTPVEINTITPTRILVGGSAALFESFDQGTTNANIGGPGANRNAMVYGGTLAGVPNAELIYVGAGSQVFKRTVAAGAINATTALPGGASTITDVALDPTNYDTVFAVDNNQVFFSSNGGTSWSDISGSLGIEVPGGIDLRTVTYVNGVGPYASYVAVGTRAGVFMSQVGSLGIWTKLGSAMPDVLVFDLIYNSADNILVAGTLGRSVWTLSNASTQGEASSTVVTHNSDLAIGDGLISLREAIYFANAKAGADFITFDPTFFTGAKTIALSSGELAITEAVNITGSAAGITISGKNASRIFNANNAGNPAVTLTGLTLTAGNAPAQGGAILASGNVTIQNCTITGNTGTFGGGIGVFAPGLFTVSDSVISNNVATSNSGGFFAYTANFQRTTISGNSALIGAGGYVGGNLIMAQCTVSGNSASQSSGGLELECYSAGHVALIQNCTFSANTAATSGGGVGLGSFISFLGTLQIQNSTFTNNKASGGNGGGGIARIGGTGLITLDSAIVSGNIDSSGNARPDLFTTGTVNANFSAVGSKNGVTTFNGDATTTGLLGAALNLGLLTNNGGSTQTHALLAGSPAINKGSNPAALAFDQRGSGFPRTSGPGVDIGAFEVTASFIVLNANDSGAGSLRQVIADANASAGPDTVTFDPTFFASAKTITLSSGELTISEAVTITGPVAGVTVDANKTSRVFNTSAAANGAVINISRMTITGGKSASDGGGIFIGEEVVTLTDCVVTGNSSGSDGGGINVQSLNASTLASLTLKNTAVTGNTAADDGAGFYFFHSGTAVVENCTISGNTATGGDGGGFYFYGTVTAGGLTVRNSTIANNKAGNRGGGIVLLGGVSVGTLNVLSSTITGNSATTNGGGIFRIANAMIITVENSIVAGNINATAPDISSAGTVNQKSSAVGSNTGFTQTDQGGNLAFGVNLLLGSLGNFGGPTQTVALLPGSPAIHAGSSTITTDQRGKSRVGAVDMGAFESQGFNFSTTGSGQSANVSTAFTNPLEVTVTPANAGEPVDGGVVTFTPPGAGASANLSSGTATIAAGKAQVNATANATVGTYDVVASANGAGSASFTLTNTAPGETPSLVVNLTTDVVNNLDNKTSLREAIAYANSKLGADTVTFDATVFATAQTILLTGGALIINDAVAINGPGASIVTVDAGGTSRVFDVTASATATPITFAGLTISGGGTNDGAGILIGDEAVTISQCIVTKNSATGDGGGIFVNAGGSLVIQQSTISNNTAQFGGGIDFYSSGGSLLLIDSTVSGNTAQFCGGLYFVGNVGAGGLTIRNSTFSGNVMTSTGGTGGGAIGVNSTGTLTIQNSTITNNTSANQGGGIGQIGGTMNVSLESTVVAGNTSTGAGPDIFTSGTVNATTSLLGSSAGITTFNPDSTTTFLLGMPANLGPLANNGGPTQTHLPAGNSILIDQGTNPAALTTDQRGTQRVIGIAADIGAVEAFNLVVSNTNYSGVGSIRQTLQHANTVTGADTVTFDAMVFGTPQLITLTGGELFISDAVTITGPGAKLVTVHGNNAGRVFNINIPGAGGAVAISGMTVTGGSAGNGGGILLQDDALTLIDCAIVGNAATITDGGGVHVAAGGSLTVRGCTFASNTAFWGGAIDFYNGGGTLAMENSTVSGNSAANSGGAIYFAGGGGAGVIIRNSTITANTASAGGGIFRTIGSPTITLTSSIVSGNLGGSSPDIYSTLAVTANFSAVGAAGGHTLTGADNLAYGANLKLGPLADNGGPTLTHALLWGSEAVGKGSNPAPVLIVDQRGKARAVNTIDIGAFELQPAAKIAKIEINGGDVQRSRVTSLAVTFDGPVIFSGAPVSAFELKRQGDNKLPNLSAAVNMSSTVVTLTFLAGDAVDFGSLADGRYDLTINASKFNGDGIDGDGNGTGGDNFSLVGTPANGLFRFFGDADGDGTVATNDFIQFRLALGGTSPVFDFDNDGAVATNDFIQFRLRFGGSI